MFSSDPAINRRHFIKHMAGMAALGATNLHAAETLKSNAPKLKKAGKHLIVMNFTGGYTHMDTFDPKPDSANGGEFKPIKTTAPGMEISEILPLIAKQAKNFSLIRSLNSIDGAHDRGQTILQTGMMPSPVVNNPSIASFISKELTPKELDVPGFIGINAPPAGPGFLGMNYSPFTIQNPGQLPPNIKPHDSVGDSKERTERRKAFFLSFEKSFVAGHGEPAKAHEAVYEKAFNLSFSDRRDIFELKGEKQGTMDAFGTSAFGRGLLQAVKLIEKGGVTVVQVTQGGWDMHNNIFNTMKMGNGPIIDKGISALFATLKERGLLESTSVVLLSDFGRTPRINQNNGRDHWPAGWTTIIGGGGIKGGVVHGATDKDGMSIDKDPVSAADVWATILKVMGIDPTVQVRDNLGRPRPVVAGKPISSLI